MSGAIAGALWLFANAMTMWLIGADIAEQKANADESGKWFFLSIGSFVLVRFVGRGPRRFFRDIKSLF